MDSRFQQHAIDGVKSREQLVGFHFNTYMQYTYCSILYIFSKFRVFIQFLASRPFHHIYGPIQCGTLLMGMILGLIWQFELFFWVKMVCFDQKLNNLV